jgi:hypothetical protein
MKARFVSLLAIALSAAAFATAVPAVAQSPPACGPGSGPPPAPDVPCAYPDPTSPGDPNLSTGLPSNLWEPFLVGAETHGDGGVYYTRTNPGPGTTPTRPCPVRFFEDKYGVAAGLVGFSWPPLILDDSAALDTEQQVLASPIIIPGTLTGAPCANAQGNTTDLLTPPQPVDIVIPAFDLEVWTNGFINVNWDRTTFHPYFEDDEGVGRNWISFCAVTGAVTYNLDAGYDGKLISGNDNTDPTYGVGAGAFAGTPPLYTHLTGGACDNARQYNMTADINFEDFHATGTDFDGGSALACDTVNAIVVGYFECWRTSDLANAIGYGLTQLCAHVEGFDVTLANAVAEDQAFTFSDDGTTFAAEWSNPVTGHWPADNLHQWASPWPSNDNPCIANSG